MTVSVRIQNENVDEIKGNLEKSIAILLERISKSNRKTLFDQAFAWVQDKKHNIVQSGFDVRIYLEKTY